MLLFPTYLADLSSGFSAQPAILKAGKALGMKPEKQTGVLHWASSSGVQFRE